MPGATSGPTPIFNNSGLNERARRLREMIAERKARPSAYRSPTHVARSSLLAKTPALIEDSFTHKMSTNNEEFDHNGDIIMKHSHPRVICTTKKSFTDPQVNGNGEEQIFATSFIKTAERERHRNPKRYFGHLTSTKYLQQILAPIIGDNQIASTKDLRRCASAKRDECTEITDYENNICAIVVPSGSTLEKPVIKVSGGGKSSTKVAECFGQSPEVVVENCDLNRRRLESAMMKPASIGEKGLLEQYARINKKPKTFSLIGDQKKSKSSSMDHLVVDESRPKSTVFEGSLNDKSVHNGHSPLVKRSDDTKKINKTLSLHSSKSLLSHQKEDCIGRIVEEDILDVKEIKSGEDSSEISASLRRPLITVTKASDSSSRDSSSTLRRRFVDRRKILSPLIDVKAFKESAEETTFIRDDANILDVNKRTARQYRRSHTTSTCNGDGDGISGTSPRRHLIGFLHRTSHLSLTSELSGDASFYLIGHRAGRRFEDSTIGSESDARLFSDDDDRSRVSTSTDITSVSRQHQANAYRKRRNRRKFRQPSRASSFSSITESSMSLDVITVTLNMDTVNFLGISIVGQSSSRGDNGIYVANIMKGGAVALDGRIEPGDMILQVNDISFENFTNDQAVDVLRESVARRGPIKLTVAKMWDGGPRSAFTVPRHRDEPVRPIDTQAWIQHTNAMRGMPSILEGSEGAPTPVPGQYGRPPSSSTMTSNGSAPNTVVGGTHIRLDTTTDKKKIVHMMVLPNSGLDIKNRTWLKIPIPMSFLGSDLVDWLMEHVDGLRDRKDGRKFAGELLKEKLISHVVNKITFTEQCYYILGDECAEFARLRQNPSGGDEQGVRSDVGSVLPPPPPGLMAAAAAQQTATRAWPQTAMLQNAPPSMVSGYASMPISPYPGQPQTQPFAPSIMHGVGNPVSVYKGGCAPDVHSQTSSNDGSSGSEHIRAGRAVLPPAPVPSLSTLSQHIQVGASASLVAGPSVVHHPSNRLDELPQDLASSRQSFRIAMSQPFEFFVDNL